MSSGGETTTTCPCCPQPVRLLFAAAKRVTNLAPDIMGGTLKEAVVAMQPLIDAHVAHVKLDNMRQETP